MSTKPRVDLYFSFRSPYSYLALDRLANWAEEDGIDLKVRPVLPLAIRTPDFFERVDPLMPRYVFADVHRVAAFHDIPFRWAQPDPVVMQFNPLKISEEQPYIHRLTRLGVEAARRGAELGFTRQVSRLIWSGAVEDWTQGDLLKDAVAKAGLDLKEMDRIILEQADELDAIIADNQTQHRDCGHWGVPCMVYEGEPFFGQDRIELLKWRVSEMRKKTAN